MPETFHFSPRPNRAGEIRWRAWGRDAFDEAARADRPVLLSLAAVWCHWCHVMDETTYSDSSLIGLINDALVPIRVDADRHPHVQDRYIAGGWPTNAFLTPTGEVLWSGTYVSPEQFQTVADGVLRAWKERREQLQVEIDRRRQALEAARSRRPTAGLVRRESADDVVTAIHNAFDPRNGGFGTEPKFPPTEALEFLAVQSERTADGDLAEMAARTLDGMLAGELWDAIEGGFFRYATAGDWTAPHFEKMLDVNAELLSAYSLGARLRGREDWRDVAERTVEWCERTLARPDGLWAGSQDADEEYYRLEASGRRERAAPFVDPVVYTNWNGRWIRALSEAAIRLERPDWSERAAGSLDALIDALEAPEGLFFHYRAPDAGPRLRGLLSDAVHVGRACIAVARATGVADYLAHARRIVEAMERELWSGGGGFFDFVQGDERVGALRYRDRPFDTNANAARLLLELATATGERSYRAVAESTLGPLSPLAGRHGVGGAGFALAVEEFFESAARV